MADVPYQPIAQDIDLNQINPRPKLDPTNLPVGYHALIKQQYFRDKDVVYALYKNKRIDIDSDALRQCFDDYPTFCTPVTQMINNQEDWEKDDRIKLGKILAEHVTNIPQMFNFNPQTQAGLRLLHPKLIRGILKIMGVTLEKQNNSVYIPKKYYDWESTTAFKELRQYSMNEPALDVKDYRNSNNQDIMTFIDGQERRLRTLVAQNTAAYDAAAANAAANQGANRLAANNAANAAINTARANNSAANAALLAWGSADNANQVANQVDQVANRAIPNFTKNVASATQATNDGRRNTQDLLIVVPPEVTRAAAAAPADPYHLALWKEFGANYNYTVPADAAARAALAAANGRQPQELTDEEFATVNKYIQDCKDYINNINTKVRKATHDFIINLADDIIKAINRFNPLARNNLERTVKFMYFLIEFARKNPAIFKENANMDSLKSYRQQGVNGQAGPGGPGGPTVKVWNLFNPIAITQVHGSQSDDINRFVNPLRGGSVFIPDISGVNVYSLYGMRQSGGANAPFDLDQNVPVTYQYTPSMTYRNIEEKINQMMKRLNSTGVKLDSSYNTKIGEFLTTYREKEYELFQLYNKLAKLYAYKNKNNETMPEDLNENKLDYLIAKFDAKYGATITKRDGILTNCDELITKLNQVISASNQNGYVDNGRQIDV